MTFKNKYIIENKENTMNYKLCDELLRQLNEWEYDHLQLMERERILEYKKSAKYKNELKKKKFERILND